MELLEGGWTTREAPKPLYRLPRGTYLGIVKLWELIWRISTTWNICTKHLYKTLYPTLPGIGNLENLSVLLVWRSSITPPIRSKADTHTIHETIHSPFCTVDEITLGISSAAVCQSHISTFIGKISPHHP